MQGRTDGPCLVLLGPSSACNRPDGGIFRSGSASSFPMDAGFRGARRAYGVAGAWSAWRVTNARHPSARGPGMDTLLEQIRNVLTLW